MGHRVSIVLVVATMSAVLDSGVRAEAAPVDVSALIAQKTVRPGEFSARDIQDLANFISESFGVPISSEMKVYDAGSPTDSIMKSAIQGFAIQRDQTLRSVLDSATESSQGLYEWREVNDIVCIMPAGTESSSDGNSILDLRISLDTQGGTTWDALKRIAKAVNQKSLHESITGPLEIGYRGYSGLLKPPASFTEELIPALTLSDITVREAVCEVLSVSPLKMSYRHLDVEGRGTLRIVVYVGRTPMNKTNSPVLTDSEHIWWKNEIDVGTDFKLAWKNWINK